MYKLVKARGPWQTEALERVTVTRAGHRSRAEVPLVIEIEPLCLVYRIKGTRTRVRLTHAKAFQLAALAQAEANRARKRTKVRRGALAM